MKTHFFTPKGIVKAVDGINLDIEKGDIVGLVGESGSGKTVTALSILRLVPHPGRIVEGEILLEGEDVLKKSTSEVRTIRGGKISMVFQDPMTFLNPVIRVGDQIAESIMLHHDLPKSKITEQVMQLLKLVGIDVDKVRYYPHQLSGGMRQRIMIAIALAAEPDLIILDEPTTSVDVVTQDKILDLLVEINRASKTAMLLITHDLGIVAQVTDRVAVAYAGKIVEFADTQTLFEHPEHPYAQGLLEALPRADRKETRLNTIPGWVPNLVNPPESCRFNERCSHVMDVCRRVNPKMIETENGHFVSCLLYQEKEE